MFIGRKKEIQVLREPNWRNAGQLIVIYGRRRVGKTALVNEAYAGTTLWKFEGIEGGDTSAQIAIFLKSLQTFTGREFPIAQHSSWLLALEAFAEAVKRFCAEASGSDKDLVILFDEFQWLAEMKSSLVALFKVVWDNSLAQIPTLKVILCGSVSSFIVKKVLRSKALYGRVTTEIHLRPLLLPEIGEFFGTKRQHREVLEIAMCFGGVPKYLEELNPRLSLQQNINELFLNPVGYFFTEVDRIFISHFGSNTIYRRIVEILSAGELTTADLAARCHTTRGGTFSATLQDLELAGFIERYVPVDKKTTSHSVRYRILDEYLHLYFSLLAPVQSDILHGTVSGSQLTASPKYAQWLGYAFERLCRRNAARIADLLRFSGIRYRAGSWFSTRRETTNGVQVDLLFDRSDRMLTVCEAKYTDRLNTDTIIHNMERIVKTLREVHPTKGIETVLILGKEVAIPRPIEQYFNRIILAKELF